ncbi:membrane protein [Filimonas lacunae]|uniref:Membrane protein n=1 Tax=Filimonas lacunae TaxID=477680 RepID=A0A173MLB1_9BACT|nr:YihY/virulence factor BrkB family protein [Filimonas lacunae]BAV08435.1 inner membrane protein YihY, formerly thought to be RNase BN [Filimonas lacunae]SIT33923.1 membrane protein [Filimonas lacunae]
MGKKIRIKDFLGLLRDAFRLLISNDPLRLAGATAFFTSFALPPILIILTQILGLLFNRKNISANLYHRLEEIVGADSTHQVITTLKGFRGLAHNWLIGIGGFVFMIFVATTLFKVIKSSMNQLWMIRVPVKQNFRATLEDRLRSLAVILIAGILFMASVVAESLQVLMGNYLQEMLPQVALIFNNVLTQVISVIVVTAWFTVMFRYLPDGRPAWRVALVGALLTSLLFTVGKVVLKRLLPGSNIGVIFGASASLVLLLLFVFYSSMILYFGAAFTKVWSVYKGYQIQPQRDALFFEYSDIPQEEKD